jgi:hypothetical protein
MEKNEQRIRRPLWVRVGLWGLRNRTFAWVFFWLSMGVAVAFTAYGLVDAPFLGAGLGVFAVAWWYYASIRWVDEHEGWSSRA